MCFDIITGPIYSAANKRGVRVEERGVCGGKRLIRRIQREARVLLTPLTDHSLSFHTLG
jgi:hypothetical protein